MKVCIAQTKPFKGEVDKNIESHLEIIKEAITLNVDLIVFPELSITGYEPSLAKKLARKSDDEIFKPFQEIADESNIVIGIGMPTKTTNGIQISMLIFQANAKRITYSKKVLHEDELAYFVKGEHQPFIEVKSFKVAFGICYETLQREHFINAVENNADVYIVSAAKPDRSIEKAYLHFPSIANEFGIPILMSNCVGHCDDFISNGKSSVWDENGNLVQGLDNETEGILLYTLN